MFFVLFFLMDIQLFYTTGTMVANVTKSMLQRKTMQLNKYGGTILIERDVISFSYDVFLVHIHYLSYIYMISILLS